jgi:hypothetical protein
MQRLLIGLSTWIIQDGNYPDFHVGREYRFALEFYPHEIALGAVAGLPGRLKSLGGALYEVGGAVAFQSPEAWVVDFGVPAYREERPPPFAVVGARIAGSPILKRCHLSPACRICIELGSCTEFSLRRRLGRKQWMIVGAQF